MRVCRAVCTPSGAKKFRLVCVHNGVTGVSVKKLFLPQCHLLQNRLVETHRSSMKLEAEVFTVDSVLWLGVASVFQVTTGQDE